LFPFEDDGTNLACALGLLLSGWNPNDLRKIQPPYTALNSRSIFTGHTTEELTKIYVKGRKTKDSDNCKSVQQREGLKAPKAWPIISL